MHEYDRNSVAARVPVPKPGIGERRQRLLCGYWGGERHHEAGTRVHVFWATAVLVVIVANNAKAIHFRISFMAFSLGEVLPEGGTVR
jgi:hypothetical protein